jgi:hypothetical protein
LKVGSAINLNRANETPNRTDVLLGARPNKFEVSLHGVTFGERVKRDRKNLDYS